MIISDLNKGMISLLMYVLACFFAKQASAQRCVELAKDIGEHIFTYDELSCLEDSTGDISFGQVLQKDAIGAFRPNRSYYPKNLRHRSTYWYKVTVHFSDNYSQQPGLFEFYDQTTDHVSAYLPDTNGKYSVASAGAERIFDHRLYRHKNFEFILPLHPPGTYHYYFRIRSASEVNVIIVYRTIEHFINYALVEYISFGLFYGMVSVFCLCNLLMYFATRLTQYVYYVLYMCSVGLYEMSVDGIAFQFLWPKSPEWNDFAYGVALYSVTLFALLFTQSLLQLKQRNFLLYKLINLAILLRTLYFLSCLFLHREWFIYKFWEFVPLMLAFLAGVITWKEGFKPARFFVIGYAFLFAGAIIKLITVLGFATRLPGALGHYSMIMGMVVEMILLSFAIADQMRIFKIEKDQAQAKAMIQMKINSDLQETENQRLEEQVEARTLELVGKTQQIREQANEILRMNNLLQDDNFELKTNIEKITDARIDAEILSLEEFTKKFPDRERCYQFLAELKWHNGYLCKKCSNDSYSEGRRPFSRRCHKCAYEESPMHDTIFQNNHIMINKAFYIVYLVFTTNGGISSYQLEERLGIRQGTCWAYAIRIKTIMSQQRQNQRRHMKSRWTDLILK